MKIVKSAYSRKPATKPVKASEEIEEVEDDVVVEDELVLEPNDILLTVEDAAELMSQAVSDIAGEEIEVTTEIADDAESVDFIVEDNTYTAIPEETDDIVVSAKLLNGKVRIQAARKPAAKKDVKASQAVRASREAAARRRRIAAARAKRQGK